MSFEAGQIDEKCVLQFKIDMARDIDADNFPIKIDILLLLLAATGCYVMALMQSVKTIWPSPRW